MIVIEIFDHFADPTHKYTTVIKVPKKLEFPSLSVDDKENKEQVMPSSIFSVCTEHNMYMYILEKEENLSG